jgi:hypothetical protein
VVELPLREGRTVYVAAGDAVVWVAGLVVLWALAALPRRFAGRVENERPSIIARVLGA